jgi:hypothetical protein
MVSLVAGEDESPQEPGIIPVSGLDQLDALGQAVLGWRGDTTPRQTWLFGAVALYTRSDDVKDPFPNFQRLVPGKIWPDLKNMSSYSLNELADGVLMHTGDMVAWRPTKSFSDLSSDQQMLAYLTGMRHLVMLESTIGDSVFWPMLRETAKRTRYTHNITDTLGVVLAERTNPVLANEFLKALASPDRSDLELRSVKEVNGSYSLEIHQNGAWSFPFEILAVTHDGDSLRFRQVELVGTEFRFLSLKRIKHIELDPDHHLVEIYRFNNHWPRIRGNWRIQPFWALPDWEVFKVVVSPVSWQDWGSQQRYGLRLNGGFGIDLMPVYPSDYRHRYSLEANSYGPMDQLESWGVRGSYQHPISWTYRLFLNATGHTYEDWQGYSVGVINYPGNQRYFIQGPDIRFRRLRLGTGYDAYQDRDTWEAPQRIRYARLDYTTFSLTDVGNRMNVRISGAYGRTNTRGEDDFILIRSKVDLSGVFASWLSGDIRIVTGYQSENMPLAYRFSDSHRWNSTLAWLPRFRGQPRYGDPVSKYLGVSFSTGYWFTWVQAKLFASTLLFSDGTDLLFDDRPRYAVGLGLEHSSFFTAGFYVPFWQSHPLPGEEPWGWRYEWKFEWNL